MGHTPTKFGETGWGVSHTGTKEVDWVRREKQWRAKKNKKMEKKTNGQKKKNLFCLEKVPCWDSNFEPFPTVPEAALWTIGVA